MDRRDWDIYQTNRQTARLQYRLWMRYQDDYVLTRTKDQAVGRVQNNRSALTGNMDIKAKDAIRAAARGIVTRHRSRSMVEVTVGKKKDFDRYASNRFRIEVGYMWGRRVLPLYGNGFDFDDFFILDAIRMKVNAPHIILYEALVGDYRSGAMSTVYIAEKTKGKRTFSVGHTAIQVLNKAYKELMKETDSLLIGEENGRE